MFKFWNWKQKRFLASIYWKEILPKIGSISIGIFSISIDIWIQLTSWLTNSDIISHQYLVSFSMLIPWYSANLTHYMQPPPEAWLVWQPHFLFFPLIFECRDKLRLNTLGLTIGIPHFFAWTKSDKDDQQNLTQLLYWLAICIPKTAMVMVTLPRISRH